MKKILSFLLAFAIILSVGVVQAFAATSSKLEKAQRVNIESSASTFRVGRTYQLSERVYPNHFDYDDVTWESDNPEIADVDSYGEVRAYSPGEVTITCRIYSTNEKARSERVGTGYKTFIVRDRDGNIVESSSETSSSSKSSSSKSSSKASSSSAAGVATAGEKVSAASVVSAIKQSLIPGTTTSTTIKNAGSISAAALKSAALEMQNGGGVVLLNFDTMNGKSVEGRITINPMMAGNIKGDIKLGVYTNDNAVSKTRTKFQRFFSNNIVLIKAEQQGSYGMKVTYSVKIDSSFNNAANLVLYSYDPSTNMYYTVNSSNIWLDNNGYVHFTTDLGDYLVISEGVLTAR